MRDAQIELLEYLTDDGKNPLRKWLEGLRDRQARAYWADYLQRSK